MKWGKMEKNDVSEAKEVKNEVKENEDMKSSKEKCKEFRDSLKVDSQALDTKEKTDKKEDNDSPNKGQREREHETGDER